MALKKTAGGGAHRRRRTALAAKLRKSRIDGGEQSEPTTKTDAADGATISTPTPKSA